MSENYQPKPDPAPNREKLQEVIGAALRAKLFRDANAAVQNAGVKHVPAVVEKLAQHALSEETGSHQAAAQFLKIVAPQLPRQFIAGAERLVGMLPEDRLPAISALLASGEIDISSAAALTATAKAECEFSFVRPLRNALGRLDEAAKSGSRAAVESALIGLSSEVKRLQSGGVIDGDGNGD